MSSLLRGMLVAEGFQAEVASSAAAARDLARSFDPDIALIDLSLGRGPSGFDLAHVLHREHPGIALIILTKHPDLRAIGVVDSELPPGTGFLRKDMVSDSAYLLAAIEETIAERTVRQDRTEQGPLTLLTDTQLAVLGLAAEGLTNAVIAARRATTERSVEEILRRTYLALGIEIGGDLNPRVEAIRQFIAVAGVPERP